MAGTEPERIEDFAQLIMRLKDTYGVSESEIARRLGVSNSTVNHWVRRQRQAPRRETLEKIVKVFPRFTREEIFAAARRKTPGPLSPESEEQILELYRGLTKEQQEIAKLQLRALNEYNRSALS